MKTLYWNRIVDVQVSNENYKTRKLIGIASPVDVFNAKKEGDVRIFPLCSGRLIGVSEADWNKFMDQHDRGDTRENLEMVADLPMSALRKPLK